MRTIVIVWGLQFVVWCGLIAVANCTGPQKATATAAVVCTADDAAKVAAILEGPGNGYQHILDLASKVGPDILVCVTKAAVVPPGPGSAK